MREIEETIEHAKFTKELMSGEFQLGETGETWDSRFDRKGFKRCQFFTKLKSTIRSRERALNDYEHLGRISMIEIDEKNLKLLR